MPKGCYYEETSNGEELFLNNHQTGGNAGGAETYVLCFVVDGDPTPQPEDPPDTVTLISFSPTPMPTSMPTSEPVARPAPAPTIFPTLGSYDSSLFFF